MVRRLKYAWIGIVPLVLFAAAFLGLIAAEPGQVAPTPTPDIASSACVPGLRKWVEPQSIMLGDQAGVTLVLTGTCPAASVPVDLIVLADESNSMTKARGVPGAATPTRPDITPGPTPTTGPPATPTDAGGIVPTPGGGNEGSEPPFCNPGGQADPGEPTKPVPPTLTLVPLPLSGSRGPEQIVPPRTPTEPPSIEELEPAGGTDQTKLIARWVSQFMSNDQITADMAEGRLRVGFVSFNKRARNKTPLTNNPSKIISAANKLRGTEITLIQVGLTEARRMLAGKDTEGHRKVILILSDFQFCKSHLRRQTGEGIEIMSLGFGVRGGDRRKLWDLATSKDYVFERPEVPRVVDMYNRDFATRHQVSLAQLRVTDRLTDTMLLVPGSVNPPTVTITGQLLEWRFEPPAMPVTLSYAVRPQAPGLWPVSVRAEALFTDTEGLPGGGLFPSAEIDVIVPTPTNTSTPTGTPTSTATPPPTETPTPPPTDTPSPSGLVLPILFRNWPPPLPTAAPTKCIPSEQMVDVAEVIDTSTSMSYPTSAGGMPKLDAAIEAARELVHILKPQDQAAIVGFNSKATIAAALTSDRSRIDAALRDLPNTQEVGTRIDLGLQGAFDELTGPHHKPGSTRSIVLVTDGMQVGPPGPEAVRAIADRIKAQGITIITVGLGTQVDAQLLEDIASSPDLYYAAPDAEDLLDIYRVIAEYIPCPGQP